jgi:hypothetical protein
MTTDKRNNLTGEFNAAVGRFWSAYATFDSRSECLGQRGKLLDAVDGVLFARDALHGMDLMEKEWDDVTRDVADMCQSIGKHGIALNKQPVQTSTGRMTYRLINKPRFDA